MNRYTAAGVLADMRNGLRVIVLCETRTLAREAFKAVAAHAADGERVRRANGQERITSADGRGWVMFGRGGSEQFRGISADVVVFDGHEPRPEALEAAAPVIAAAHGEIIRP